MDTTLLIRATVLISLLTATVILSPAYSRDYDPAYNDGLLASEAGDYDTAVSKWQPLAAEGNAAAQFNLALMYHRGLGVAHDDILINQDWGFDLTEIKPRIDIWHGHLDVNVPIHAAQYLRDVLPIARTHLQPEAGHFFVFEHWGEILAALISAN